jgi:hypothetical protein
MKKTIKTVTAKKLNLARETVRVLDQSQLGAVGGGAAMPYTKWCTGGDECR